MVNKALAKSWLDKAAAHGHDNARWALKNWSF